MTSRNLRRTQNLVDFGLFITAKEFYEAAKLIKGNEFVSRPYHVILSFSVELFLKSIQTTTVWPSAVASSVEHTKGHSLAEIFASMESKHPEDSGYLEEKYHLKHGRSLKHDLSLNSDVFMKQRYPYQKGGAIPSISVFDRDLLNPQYGNDIAVYVDELERVASFLHDELIVHFPGLFDNVSTHG
ncbi:hypothetical protein P3748_24130 [Vibrio parahaemolyticus]|nr:hypothetical protein [Vibrio parahaemolyticus]MDF5039030.1 hypothetical protein [Vibrio parahaemolyticus]MDF5223101.1 hypothetical protein [Vibrio parahaemolyticus]MDF5688278.1 hypothetical protein [Vibrio parahaemolyticus]